MARLNDSTAATGLPENHRGRQGQRLLILEKSVVPAQTGTSPNRLSGESRNPDWLGTSVFPVANGLQSIGLPSYAKVSEGGNLEPAQSRVIPEPTPEDLASRENAIALRGCQGNLPLTNCSPGLPGLSF